jgi:hypothetical protein
MPCNVLCNMLCRYIPVSASMSRLTVPSVRERVLCVRYVIHRKSSSLLTVSQWHARSALLSSTAIALLSITCSAPSVASRISNCHATAITCFANR